LRGRGVVQKPRAKRRAESGGALRRDDSASRLAAHYRQRRKNGVVQTRHLLFQNAVKIRHHTNHTILMTAYLTSLKSYLKR